MSVEELKKDANRVPIEQIDYGYVFGWKGKNSKNGVPIYESPSSLLNLPTLFVIELFRNQYSLI